MGPGVSIPVRVLHCSAHLGTGGISGILLRTLPAFDPATVVPSVCHLGPRIEDEGAWRRAGVAVHCLDHSGTLRGARTLRRLLRLVTARRIDVIHTHRPLDRFYGGLVARLRRVPHVTTLHNTTPPERLVPLDPRNLRSGGSLGELLLRTGPVRYVAVSETVRTVQVEARGLPPERTTVIYHGLGEEAFRGVPPGRTARLREELGLPAAAPVLLNVGRLHPDKGQGHLVPMMEALLRERPDAVLLIAGEGELRHELQGRFREAGLGQSVRLLGRRSDVRDLLALADLFVFPSLREGLPMAVVEACAAGVPVIASRIRALEEVVEDAVSARLVPPGAPREMAAAARELLGSKELRDRLGAAGRSAAVRRFSLGATVDALTGVYLDAAGAPQPGAETPRTRTLAP